MLPYFKRDICGGNTVGIKSKIKLVSSVFIRGDLSVEMFSHELRNCLS